MRNQKALPETASAILTKSAEERARFGDPVGELPHHLVAWQRYRAASRSDAHPPKHTNGERRIMHDAIATDGCSAYTHRQ